MENQKELKQFEITVKFIVSLPFIIMFAYMLCIHFSPPKTIEENGHTYHLADENDVDDEIEKYGYRYILADADE